SITFTFRHMATVATNAEGIETVTAAARGRGLACDLTEPSSWRASRQFDRWLRSRGISGMAGVDTRQLTRRIRDGGAPNGVIVHAPDGKFDIDALVAEARAWPGLEGMDLALDVTCRQTFHWDETQWQLGHGYGRQEAPRFKVVA